MMFAKDRFGSCSHASPSDADSGAGAPVLPDPTAPSDSNFREHPEWNQDCVARVAAHRGKRCDVIFVGDSITHMWSGVGAAVWERYYGHRHALNFGVGGDQTSHLLWRLENWNVTEWKPKAAVVLIGTNNVDHTPEQVGAGVAAVVASVRSKFPGVKIVVLGILPNDRGDERLRTSNRAIAERVQATDVVFVDAGKAFVPEGQNWRGLSEDKLHLNEQGYEQLAAALEPELAKVLG